MSNPLSIAPVRHLDRGKSWILPDAGKQWLLYVSDGSTGTIDIYNYRIRVGKLYGQITGFTFPYGQCIDRAGDVYVVDNATAKIYEFAHGATSPLATATDDYGSPIGCSVNPTTGDVAVSNFSESGSGSGAGGLDIFAGGLSGNQTDYTSSNFYRLFPPGYDPKGNLFVQAMDYSGAKYLAELPAVSRRHRPGLPVQLRDRYPSFYRIGLGGYHRAYDGAYRQLLSVSQLHGCRAALHRGPAAQPKRGRRRQPELSQPRGLL
jgi:hypothetical protein